MSAKISERDARRIKITKDTVSRWGCSIPEAPDDVPRAIQIAFGQAIAAARRVPFKAIYPDDHSWMSAGLRGMSVSRIKNDEETGGSDSSGEEWGIAAIVAGFDYYFIVPIAIDLDSDVARSIVSAMDGNENEWLDLSNASALLSAKQDKDNIPDDAEISVNIFAASWLEIIDLSRDAILPMHESIFFRRPVVWDLMRARMVGTECPPLPEFSKDEFQRRFNFSMRMDRRQASETLAYLDLQMKRSPNLDSAEGINWFSSICNGLNSLGMGKSFNGLSVVLSLRSLVSMKPEWSEDVPLDAVPWSHAGVRNICVAYGLDPVQASYIIDLVRKQPEAFYIPGEDRNRQLSPIGALVIPDMHLSTFRVTLENRDEDAYNRLFKATQRSGWNKAAQG